MSTNRKDKKCLWNTIDGNIFNKHNDQGKKILVKRIFFTCIGYFKRWVNFNKTLCADIIIHVFRYLSNMNKTGITTVGKNISCPSPIDMLLTYLSVSSVQLRHVDNLV
jgi:hypothetical protein